MLAIGSAAGWLNGWMAEESDQVGMDEVEVAAVARLGGVERGEIDWLRFSSLAKYSSLAIIPASLCIQPRHHPSLAVHPASSLARLFATKPLV